MCLGVSECWAMRTETNLRTHHVRPEGQLGATAKSGYLAQAHHVVFGGVPRTLHQKVGGL
jgi:hypothetical protein